MSNPAKTAPRVTGVSRLIAIAAATIGIIYGYDIGNIAGALLFIKPDLGLSDYAAGTVTSVVVFGNIVGALVGGPLATKIGRKPTMLIVAAGYAVFAAWSAFTSELLWLDISRFFLGITIGFSLVVAPIFIAESAPAALRGGLVVGYQVATVTGILLGYLVDLALADTGNWELMLGLSAIPSILVFLLLIKLPDTPRWYLMKGRTEQARATMALIDPNANLDETIAAIAADMKSERGGGLTEIVRKPYSRATIFVVVLGFAVQITGINAITYYSPTIFEKMGYSGYGATLGLPSVIQGAALLATIGSVFVVDRFGRRPLLMSGIGSMVLASIMMVVVFATGNISNGSIAGFIGILIFTMGFNFGFGSLVWVYASESFPARLRGLGASLMLTADLVANLIVGQFFLPILTAIGGGATFAIFGALALLALVFVLKFAPETRGRQLEHIRYFWENGGRWPAEK